MRRSQHNTFFLSDMNDDDHLRGACNHTGGYEVTLTETSVVDSDYRGPDPLPVRCGTSNKAATMISARTLTKARGLKILRKCLAAIARSFLSVVLFERCTSEC